MHDPNDHFHPEQSEDTAHDMPFVEEEPPERKTRLALLLRELPSALGLALLTAAVTLILAILLSTIMGAENVRHREANRCQSALIVSMLRDAYSLNPVYEPIRDRYPEVNLEGIDCTPYLVEPLDDGGP
jgi:hypothetical protein